MKSPVPRIVLAVACTTTATLLCLPQRTLAATPDRAAWVAPALDGALGPARHAVARGRDAEAG